MPAPVASIIPCCEQAHLWGGALASCTAQYPLPAEIIVIDDNSPDDISAAAEPFAERPPIRLVRWENGGLSFARSTELEVSRSPHLVVFLDADDRLCPGAVAAGLDSLEAHAHAAFVWGGYRNTDLKRLASHEAVGARNRPSGLSPARPVLRRRR